MMNRPRLQLGTVAACAAVIAVCSCGGDTASPKQIVEDTYAAMADGDGEKACANLNNHAQGQLVTQAMPGLTGADTCEKVVQFVASELSSDERDALKHVTVKKVEEDGDKVTVDDEAVISEQGAMPSDSNPDPLVLVKEDDTWKIDDLG